MSLLRAVVADVLCVMVFVMVGRSSHAEPTDLLGVAGTAWPFLVGVTVGLVVARAWRFPASTRTGVVVWLCAVTGGVVLRLATGANAPVSFVIVTAAALGLLLVGWRVLSRLGCKIRVLTKSRRQLTAPVSGSE